MIPGNFLPFVTIIMPVRNESACMWEGLTAIVEQDYSLARMEVLIADGMSMDNTRSIIHDFAVRYPQLQLHILDNPGKIVPTGMNAALCEAKGEIVVRVDGHTILAPDYIRQCVETLQRTGADNAGGRMNSTSSNAFGEVVALATSMSFGIGDGHFHYSNEEEWVDTVYMGAWPRPVFKKIGLFDEELVRDQDDEFNYRLRAAGGGILLSPKIKSQYVVRGTPGALWRQYYQYGYWKVRVLQKHPRQMSARQFVPPAFVLSLLASGMFAISAPLRALSLLVPSLYVVANATASLRAASRNGWKYFVLLPVVFSILHLSYGLGFLVGLVKFWNRWGDRAGKVPVWPGEISG
jgi:succinoglycan biosynthesis protein ExoA